MDASVSSATTVEEYLGSTSPWRNDEYSYGCPTLVSHAESIVLIDGADPGFAPELKSYTQGNIALTYDDVRVKLAEETLLPRSTPRAPG